MDPNDYRQIEPGDQNKAMNEQTGKQILNMLLDSKRDNAYLKDSLQRLQEEARKLQEKRKKLEEQKSNFIMDERKAREGIYERNKEIGEILPQNLYTCTLGPISSQFFLTKATIFDRAQSLLYLRLIPDTISKVIFISHLKEFCIIQRA